MIFPEEMKRSLKVNIQDVCLNFRGLIGVSMIPPSSPFQGCLVGAQEDRGGTGRGKVFQQELGYPPGGGQVVTQDDTWLKLADHVQGPAEFVFIRQVKPGEIDSGPGDETLPELGKK